MKPDMLLTFILKLHIEMKKYNNLCLSHLELVYWVFSTYPPDPTQSLLCPHFYVPPIVNDLLNHAQSLAFISSWI